MKRRSVELVLFVLAHDSRIENRVRIRAFEELILQHKAIPARSQLHLTRITQRTSYESIIRQRIDRSLDRTRTHTKRRDLNAIQRSQNLEMIVIVKTRGFPSLFLAFNRRKHKQSLLYASRQRDRERMRYGGFYIEGRRVELVSFLLAHDCSIQNRIEPHSFEKLDSITQSHPFSFASSSQAH